MKFAKQLDDELIPEWRAKYFDYKIGKKKVKAITRALSKANRTPQTPEPRQRGELWQTPTATRRLSPVPSLRAEPSSVRAYNAQRRSSGSSEPGTRVTTPTCSHPGNIAREVGARSPLLAQAQPGPSSQGRNLASQNEGATGKAGVSAGYGSISSTTAPLSGRGGPPSLRLPGPALSSSESRNGELDPRTNGNPSLDHRASSTREYAYDSGQANHPSSKMPRATLHNNRVSSASHVDVPRRRKLFSRMMSLGHAQSPQFSDVPMEHYRLFDLRLGEFYGFLDRELEKIDSFYRVKEAEASRRLELLEEQLREMKDRRIAQVSAAEQEQARAEQTSHTKSMNGIHKDGSSHQTDKSISMPWGNPSKMIERLREGRIGKDSQALTRLGPTQLKDSSRPNRSVADDRRDFTRRKHQDDVPYRVAKRKLKLALQEFYRGLELLKSYALLNQTAFRKINKKCEKAIQAKQSGQYMIQKVNRAHFVKSELLDNFLVTVENLYAQYFERGNHKVAVNKLRRKLGVSDLSGNVFRNGLLLASGFILSVEAVVNASNLFIRRLDPEHTQVSFLLQLYAGYFLSLLLFMLFCLDCRVWSRAKINYVFVFEFDTRHNLDWRQLSELPCFFFFLEGLTMWLNFYFGPTNRMFLYWPVLLVGLSAAVLFLPARLLYHRSRAWWAYSNFRLVLAGLYPVEFRDFFLGDMFCSLTYAMGNVEVFFCLYAHRWQDMDQCNSSNSRLLGFLSCLPGIWRALQCIRRYYDTRNVFPHLVNCGKYTCTIMFYMTLSIYRIDRSWSLQALFIAFATINSVYCSIWDLLMDWSLGDPYAKNPFLRDVLGYKKVWIYYLAMIVDPLLRFNWVFYVAFPVELQHSALLSFFVSFSEILRRGMWTLFRVENEHCTNVGRFRASRDIPLPYEVSDPEEVAQDEFAQSSDQPTQSLNAPDRAVEVLAQPLDGPAPTASTTSIETVTPSPDLERATGHAASPTPGSLRRRRTLADAAGTPIIRGLARVGTAVAAAHSQDYERKRKAPTSSGGDKSAYHGDSGGSSDEDEEDDELVVHTSEQGIDSAGEMCRQRSHEA